MTRNEFIRRFPNASESAIAANCSYSPSSGAELKSSPGDESVAEASGENPCATKCLVRITSFRLKLIDGDNLHAKAFVDSLETAGAIFKDSPEYCEVKVDQLKVDYPWQEKTVIEIIW